MTLARFFMYVWMHDFVILLVDCGSILRFSVFDCM